MIKNWNFLLLWIGHTVSALGDWVHTIALTVLVYRLTGSGLAISTMLISKIVPTFLVGSFGGVFVDRWNRKWTMIACDFLRALIVLGFLAVRRPGDLVLVIVLNILLSTATSLFKPAKSAMVPQIVHETEVVKANSILEGSGNFIMLVGTLVGGVLTGVLGPYQMFLANSASFAVSGFAIMFIGVAGPLKGARIGRNVLAEWRQGLQFMGSHGMLLYLILVYSGWSIGVGAGNVMLVVFANNVFSAGARGVGGLYAAVSGGALVGAFLCKLLFDTFKVKAIVPTAVLLCGLVDVLFGLSRTLFQGMSLLALAGLIDGILTISVESMIMKVVPGDLLGRIFGAYGALVTSSTMVGMLLGGMINDIIGARFVMIGAGMVMILVGLIATLWGVFRPAMLEAPDAEGSASCGTL